MEIIDKYNIIENHTSNDQTITCTHVESFITKLMNVNNKIIISDYITQLNWFKILDQDKIIDIINTTIKKYLVNKRKIIRDEIKKINFKLDKFISFLELFKNKIKNIQSLFVDQDCLTLLRKTNLNNLSKIIITDSIILLDVQKCLDIYDLNNKLLLIQLYNICDIDIGVYDKHKTMDKLLLTIAESINKKSIIKTPTHKLPADIVNINNTKLLIDYISMIRSYYDFISKDNINFIFSKSISNKLFENIMNIITSNKDAVIHVFDNCPNIYDLIIYNENIFNMCTELVNIIDKFNTNESFDCIKIIKIIKIINTIYEKIYSNKLDAMVKINTENINIHITKIFMILSSNLNNIVKTIDILIKETIVNNELIASNLKIIKDIIFIISKKGINNKCFNSKLHLDYFQQFVDLYYDYLIKRTLNFDTIKSSLLLNFEKDICTDLIAIISKKLTYKINLVVNDYECNSSRVNDYECNPSRINDNIIFVGSYDAYPINYSNGYINNIIIETQLGKIINDYENKYLVDKPNKKLNWYLHYGEVDVTYLDKQFKLLPIQLLILESIEKEEDIVIEKVFGFKFLVNYTKEYINNLIHSLIITGLVKNRNNKLSITTNKDDINETDLIDIFFNNINYKPIQKDFAHTKTDIINATINHYLKKSPLDKISLYDKIKDDISLFNIEQDDYDKSLNYMIKMDYIILNNGLYEKLLF